MFPHYSFPPRTVTGLLRDLILSRRRSFRADALACIGRLKPSLQVLGEENIPQMGPCVITFNHYYRPGFNAIWMPVAIVSRIPAEMHFVMTGELTYPGKWYAPLGMFLSKIVLRRAGRVYGFTPMPPMPPRPKEVEARADAVRRVLEAVRHVRTELQADVADEQPGQPARPAKDSEEDEIEQRAKQDERTPAAPARMPAIRERTRKRLAQHGGRESHKGQQAEGGVLLRVGDEIEQDRGQDNGMQGIPHERQPHPVGVEREQLGQVEFLHIHSMATTDRKDKSDKAKSFLSLSSVVKFASQRFRKQRGDALHNHCSRDCILFISG